MSWFGKPGSTFPGYARSAQVSLTATQNESKNPTKVAHNSAAHPRLHKTAIRAWQRNGLHVSIQKNNQKFRGGNLKVFRLNDEGTTVPAFSFEKIPAPPRIEPAAPAVDAKRRGRFARLVDRLAELRMRSSGRRAVRAKPRKVKGG